MYAKVGLEHHRTAECGGQIDTSPVEGGGTRDLFGDVAMPSASATSKQSASTAVPPRSGWRSVSAPSVGPGDVVDIVDVGRR